jgi:urease subunit beta
LVPYAGTREVYGFNAKVEGKLDSKGKEAKKAKNTQKKK